jgi:hypothetical protein
LTGVSVLACEHGQESHDGTEPSAASAPEASRAWLLIEHPGPWPHEPADAALPAPLAALAASAVALGVRVQMIRRPGRPRLSGARTIFAGWTAGSVPWLRREEVPLPGAPLPGASRPGVLAGLDVERLASGRSLRFGSAVREPVFLVCAHGRRSGCCGRFGAPVARALAARHPGQVWETTHVGGHRYAANLVILPHGLYYGPVDLDAASAAISAYQRGAVVPGRYRGRAGQPRPVQEAEHARLTRTGSLPVAALALGGHGERWSADGTRSCLHRRGGALRVRAPMTPGRGPQLADARRAGQDDEQDAAHGGQQQRHSQRDVTVRAQVGNLDRLAVLQDEDQQEEQQDGEEADGDPDSAGPGALDPVVRERRGGTGRLPGRLGSRLVSLRLL